MRPALILFTLVMLSMPCSADTIYVPGDYGKIQQGIDAALDGDTVLVAPGTYMEKIDFKGKAITVKSSNGAGATVLDAWSPGTPQYGSVVRFLSGEGLDSVLEGFTLKNGSGTLAPPYRFGGGIYCTGSSPTIRYNLIRECAAVQGGGMYCFDGAPAIHDNIILKNTASYGGGLHCTNVSGEITGNSIFNNQGHGIFCWGKASSPLRVSCNQIAKNTALVYLGGGGVWCGDHTVVEHNLIEENHAVSYGGGVCPTGDTAVIRYNRIVGNSTGHDGLGGGILCWNASPVISNNIIAHNFTGGGGKGGGICCFDLANPVIAGNMIHSNTAANGGGIHCFYAGPVITNNTLFGNVADGGGGLDCFDSQQVTVTNTILWSNTAVTGAAVRLWNNSALTVDHCDVQGGLSSVYVEFGSTLNWTSNLDADPLFVDPAAADLHLTHPSPCVGLGDPAASGIPETDFEGDPIQGPKVDTGADTFHLHLYHTGDAAPGGTVEVKITAWPFTAPVRLWVGSGVLEHPIPTLYGDWHLQFPLLLTIPLPPIPVNGVLRLPAAIPATAPAWEVPLQAGVGSTLTNLSIMSIE